VKAGEQVVVRANFLIDAESNLKAALGTFSAPAHRGNGTVASVEPQGGKVELEHEAMPSLGWPAMTMEFSVADKGLLTGLRPGDRVEFEVAARGEGEYVIQSLKKHKGH
jgi:Cu/Ag efflux protein CusF